MHPATANEVDATFTESTVTQSGTFTFVRSSVKKGIVPAVLEVFLAERKRVKAQLQRATDPALRAVLNGKAFDHRTLVATSAEESNCTSTAAPAR